MLILFVLSRAERDCIEIRGKRFKLIMEKESTLSTYRIILIFLICLKLRFIQLKQIT